MYAVPSGDGLAFTDGLNSLGRGSPSAVLENVSDSVAETFENEGYFLPEWAEGVSIADLPEKGFVSFYSPGQVDFYRFSGNVSGLGEFDTVTEYEGREILTDGDSYVVQIGENRYASHSGSEDEDVVVDAMRAIIDGSESSNEGYMASDPAGQLLEQFEEGQLFISHVQDDDSLEGSRFRFEGDHYKFQLLEGSDPSSLEISYESEFEAEEIKGQPF